MFRGKAVEEITEADLRALVENQVIELKTTEYKEALPVLKNVEAKREFAKDVTSFANAEGGHLLYGIPQDKHGMPLPFEGVETAELDAAIRTYDSVLRDNVRPRIPGLKFQPVAIGNGRSVLILEVPKSWVGPHIVECDEHRFWSRATNGKYRLDVGELRLAFMAAETVTERLRRFREERATRLLDRRAPVPMVSSTCCALHLVPVTAFALGKRYDIRPVENDPGGLRPLTDSGSRGRHTLEGFLRYFGVASHAL